MLEHIASLPVGLNPRRQSSMIACHSRVVYSLSACLVVEVNQSELDWDGRRLSQDQYLVLDMFCLQCRPELDLTKSPHKCKLSV